MQRWIIRGCDLDEIMLECLQYEYVWRFESSLDMKKGKKSKI